MQELEKQAARQWTTAVPVVSAFVSSVVRDYRDRDDILQDIAVAVFDKYGTYDPSRPFLPWVMGIARNQIGLYLRRRRRDRLVFDDETVRCLAVAFGEQEPATVRKLDDLQDCVTALEGRAREVCDLRYQLGLKPQEIGARLGMAASAVAKALQRIREQLRDCVNRKAAAEGGSA